MQFDDMEQPMIWRERSLCEGVHQPEIVVSLLNEAFSEGYEPMDFNGAGVPNVYLRAKFAYEVDDQGKRKPDTERWVEDGYVLFVQKKQSEVKNGI